MQHNDTNRREFLRQAAGTAAGLAMAGSITPQARAASGKRFVIGMMGSGGRGKFLLRHLMEHNKDVHIAYVCDPDSRRMAEAAALVEKGQGVAPQAVGDFRRILDDKDVHALFVITPDHWHALPTILACQAGKDVFVEKPASHSIWEGRKMVEAARKYERIVQHGTQTRSGGYVRSAIDYIRSGRLGRVHLVRVLNMKERRTIGRKEDAPVPEGVDYDMWLGPAPARPFNPNHFHYNWHWFWDYSGGDIINDGVHQIDLARWLIGQRSPKSVSASGGPWFFDDDQETPDTQIVTWDFDNLAMVFEMTLWTPYMKKQAWELRDTDSYPDWQFDGMRVEVFGSRGMMFMMRHGGGWQVYDADNKIVAEANDRHPHRALINNFFECIQTRSVPHADIEEGHLSTVLCQIGNISYRVGGRKLQWDAAAEQFVGDEEANGLIKRTYREPWVVPETV